MSDDIQSLVTGKLKLSAIARLIIGIPLRQGFRKELLFVLTIAFSLFVLFLVAITWLFIKGVGIWGINIPVAWGFAITNYVWWIGIGQAGTFISAFLYLMHQNWRASINRFAETMTLFAVMSAAIFPLLHLGRPWFFYWLVPYPNSMGLWPQFNSALIWDFFAIFTYLVVSVLFWYMGIIPDLALARDQAVKTWVKRFYAILSLGWRSAGSHWKRHKKLYMLIAGLATPLVVSVHTVVSFDFAVALVPGWHSTIFPPYFVAGAIFSGLAMALTLMLPIRKMYHLENIITSAHLDKLSKITLTTGLIVGYGYVMETFIGWYSNNFYEWYHILNKLGGNYGFLYWTVLFCNVASIQILWIRSVRKNPLILFILSIFINIGMWVERLMIVIVGLHRDFLTSSWGMYYPTFWDWATFFGVIGFFLCGFLLFFRVFPMFASFEVEELETIINERHTHASKKSS